MSNIDRTIYLSWQPSDHGRRYIVATFTEKGDGAYSFRYLLNQELEEAKKMGFKGYPAFPDLQKEYIDNVMDPFIMRLPSRARTDFQELLNYWELYRG